jgi:hypothetical protein
LRARVAAVKGSGTYSDSRRTGTAVRSYDVEFFRKPGSFKYTIRNHTFVGNGVRTATGDSAVCSSPLTSFALSKGNEASAFQVSRVGKAPFATGTSAPLPKFLDCAFSLGGYSLPELLADTDFELSKAEELTVGAKKNYKITFQRNIKPQPGKTKTQVLVDGWIIVSPQDHWATRQYEFRQANVARGNEAGAGPIITSGLVEYGEGALGTPVPRRAEVKTFIRLAASQRQVKLGDGLHDGDVLRTESFDFKRIQMEPDADDAFASRAFGLPNLDSSRK